MRKCRLLEILILIGGASLLGYIGTGCTRTPQPPDVIARYNMVTAGDDLTCSVVPGGYVNCWGDNRDGEFGDGTKNPSLEVSTVSSISNAIEVAAGSKYACAVLSDGTLSCWGANVSGQLGTGTFAPSLIPKSVTGVSGAIHVATGTTHTCAVTLGGTVKCWGIGFNGQLGNGISQTSLTPVNVVGISTATAVTVGYKHSCALLRDGTVMCWGDNGTTSPSSKPLAVPGIQATAIAAGGNHTCVLLSDGTIKCWGWASDGQLGNGVVGNGYTPNPVQVTGLTGAIGIAAGYGHTCAVLADRTVRWWGRNEDGQLGNGTTTPKGIPNPVKVSGITSAVTVTAGFSHTCALLTNRTLKCWGNNSDGQLTNGTQKSSSVPVP